MAEERRAGKHPSEALREMGEKSHACHGIWSEIQKVEAIGVHDVIEEIRERGAEPAGEVINEEGVPIRAGLGETGGDDARGRVPLRLAPPQGLKVVPEVDRVDCRRRVGELRPPCRQLALRHLLPPASLATPLPLLVLVAMAAARGKGEGRRGRGGSEQRQDLEREEEGDSGSEIEESTEGK